MTVLQIYRLEMIERIVVPTLIRHGIEAEIRNGDTVKTGVPLDRGRHQSICKYDIVLLTLSR